MPSFFLLFFILFDLIVRKVEEEAATDCRSESDDQSKSGLPKWLTFAFVVLFRPVPFYVM